MNRGAPGTLARAGLPELHYSKQSPTFMVTLPMFIGTS